MMSTIRGFACALLLLVPTVRAEVPHLINFQGVLQMGGAEVSGTYEITFRLYGTSTGGVGLWSETDSVYAEKGYYAVILGQTVPLGLDFNQPLWLALQITGQAEMTPRFMLTSSPSALAIADDAVDSSKIADGSVVLQDVAQSGAGIGQVPKWNGTAWVAANDEIGAAPATPWLDDGSVIRMQSATDSVGIGTASPAAKLEVSGTIYSSAGGFRFPDGSIQTVASTTTATPWTSSSNGVSLVDITDSVGIGTSNPTEKLDVGGNLKVSGKASIGSGNTNAGQGAFVAGSNNSSVGAQSTVTGGLHNYAGASGATISGGTFDSATGTLATIGGGTINSAAGDGSTVSGGRNNTARSLYTTIGGGHTNIASADYATVSGGKTNSATALFSWVGGGVMDSATGDYSSVAGGTENHADGDYSSVGGGVLNRAGGNRSTISGGSTNSAAGLDATVGGGLLNNASDQSGTVSGGGHNAAVGNYATVGGGFADSARGTGAIVSGGYRNIAGKEYSTVSGGSTNKADSNYAVVGGGLNNVAMGYAATVGGGIFDTASGDFATVSGGRDNTASGDYSIAVGRASTAAGDNSMAVGLQAKALHDGSFVWADMNGTNYNSTAENEFSVRASGGIRIHSNLSLTAGVTMSPGASSWTAVSDRNLKENIRELNGSEILGRIARLPISRWNYIAQDESIEHVGPMAQDFYGLFGLGEDSKHIDMLDPAGIALAGIKELYRQNQQLHSQNQRLTERLAALEAKLK
jgi:hypothetical protein